MTIRGFFGIPLAAAMTYSVGVTTVTTAHAAGQGNRQAQADYEKMISYGPSGSAAIGYATHLLTKVRGAPNPLRATLVTSTAMMFYFVGIAQGGAQVQALEAERASKETHSPRR